VGHDEESREGVDNGVPDTDVEILLVWRCGHRKVCTAA
jgi:hypothetical protein